jgi:hypothetical protein
MITIAINEPVILAKAAKDTEGRLELSFEEIVETKEDTNNPFDALSNEGYSDFGSTARTMSIKVFGFKNTKHDGSKLDSTMISKDISGLKDQLFHILSGYITSDKIKFGGNVLFADTGVDGDNYNEKITDQAVLNKVYDNLCTAFIDTFNDLPNKADHFRLLLVRQSKKSTYAGLRKNFVKDNPFWEPITVPKEQSRLKYTPYEIKEGLNKADTPDLAADLPVGAAAPSADEVFGV